MREIHTEWTSKKRIFREPIHPGRWRVSFGFGLFGNGSTAAARKIFQILDVSSFIGVHRYSSVAKISFPVFRPRREEKNCHRCTPMDTDVVWLKRPTPKDSRHFVALKSPDTSLPRVSQIMDVPTKKMNRKERKGRKAKINRIQFPFFSLRPLRSLRFEFFSIAKQPSGPLGASLRGGLQNAARKIFPILDLSSFIGVHRCSSVAKTPFSEVRPSLEGKNKKNCHRCTPMDTDAVWLKRPTPKDPRHFVALKSPDTSLPRVSQIMDVPTKQMNRKERKGRKAKINQIQFPFFSLRPLRSLRFEFFCFSKPTFGSLIAFDLIGVIP